MQRLTALTVALLLLIGSSDVGANTTTVRILGDETFVPNAVIMATFRFNPGPLSATSGGVVTWDNTATGGSADEPHTVTLVTQDQLPAAFDEIFECMAPGEPCGNALAAHFPAPDVVVPVVNVGAAGLDMPGDSILIFPHATATATISAPAGSTLYYLCAIHPWMQGSITVR